LTKTLSTMLALGTPVPQFRLPNVDGRLIADGDFPEARGLLVAFTAIIVRS
jgi:peroxiredoxin